MVLLRKSIPQNRNLKAAAELNVMHFGDYQAMADWDFYQANVNDKIASIYLNLEAEAELSQKHNTLYWFFIKLKVEREDGLSHDKEFDALVEYEDKLIDAICSEKLRYVGRVTTDGMRQFYFYGIENLAFEELCKSFVEINTNYLCQFNSKPDPELAQFKNVLFPGPSGVEQISERRKNA